VSGEPTPRCSKGSEGAVIARIVLPLLSIGLENCHAIGVLAEPETQRNLGAKISRSCHPVVADRVRPRQIMKQALQQAILAQFIHLLEGPHHALWHSASPAGSRGFQLALAGGNLTFQLFLCCRLAPRRSYSSEIESWRTGRAGASRVREIALTVVWSAGARPWRASR